LTIAGSGIAALFALPSAAGGGLGEIAPRPLAANVADVLLVLEDDAERLVDELRRELARAQRQEGGGPVERLGDPRDLGQVGLAKPVDEGDDLAGEAFGSRTPSARSGSRSSGRGSGA
jgi:hypothetical protein